MSTTSTKAARRPWLLLITGAALSLLGPALGFAASAWISHRTFSTVVLPRPGQPAPREDEFPIKPATATKVGLVVGAVGAVLVILAIARFDRMPRSEDSELPLR